MRGTRFNGVVGRSGAPRRYFFVRGVEADNIYLASNMGNAQGIVWDLAQVDDPEGGLFLEFDPGTSTTRIAVLQDITIEATAGGHLDFPFAYVGADWQEVGGAPVTHTAGTATLDLRFLDAGLSVIDAFSDTVNLDATNSTITGATHNVDLPAGSWIEGRITFTSASPAVDLELAGPTLEMYYRA